MELSDVQADSFMREKRHLHSEQFWRLVLDGEVPEAERRTQLTPLAETNFLAGVDSLLYKKLSYCRRTTRCVVSIEILPIGIGALGSQTNTI